MDDITPPDAISRAIGRLRHEHSPALEWLPGAIAWFCTCGARSAVSGSYRTEKQVQASMNRHLRAALKRLIDEEQSPEM